MANNKALIVDLFLPKPGPLISSENIPRLDGKQKCDTIGPKWTKIGYLGFYKAQNRFKKINSPTALLHVPCITI